MTHILFTGGGTAGHVTPNLALIDHLQREGWKIDYAGSYHGVEKAMITARSIPYHAVKSGKLRRYFSWQNFSDPWRILAGIWQAFWLLRRLHPDLVFSKGGFVAFPVVVGAWLNRIPVLAHESDMTPGLANRLSYPFASKIFVSFPSTKKYFKRADKVRVTGTPIRESLFHGDKSHGLALCGFDENKPCLLVVGGSQGSSLLNASLRQALPDLLKRYQIIHLCGKGKVNEALNQSGYCQLEYANDELPDLFAAADMIISRAGANALCEILALGKPHLLIPLSAEVSRGDQVQNARYFELQGASVILNESALAPAKLVEMIDQVYAMRENLTEKIRAQGMQSGVNEIIRLMKEEVHAGNKTAL